MSIHMHSKLQLVHAARRADWTMFEYLLEQGGMISSNADSDADTQAVDALVRRRGTWIDAAGYLAHQHRIPSAAVRTIHEYLVGYNWQAVCDAIFRTSDNPSSLNRSINPLNIDESYYLL